MSKPGSLSIAKSEQTPSITPTVTTVNPSLNQALNIAASGATSINPLQTVNIGGTQVRLVPAATGNQV